MKTRIGLITEERERQISQEGYAPEHDDQHLTGELLLAAWAYIDHAQGFADEDSALLWPWCGCDFKPSQSPIRDLTKAGALIAAEIDRIQRLELQGGEAKK